MASLYLWLKFLHLFGLGAFLLGHGVSAGASLMLRRPLADAMKGALLQVSMRANYVALPGLGVLLITGVLMGFLGSWWHWGWIWTAIAVLVAVMVVMSAQSVPYHSARDAVGANKPAAELEGQLQRARPVALAIIGTLGLVVLIFLMVFKPF
jgi:divalent metal cation (Fe/Co/Zn/Cd) transporter